MEYLTVIRKRDNKMLRILKLEIQHNGENETDRTEIWYIVPIYKGVMAMTPGDFDMGYEIQPE